MKQPGIITKRQRRLRPHTLGQTWLVLALGLAACSSSDDIVSSDDAEQTPESSVNAIARAPSITPARTDLTARQEVAPDRLVLRVTKAAKQLQSGSGNDPKQLRLLQDKLGPDVKVRAARTLADGDTLEVFVEKTTPEKIQSALSRASSDPDIGLAEPVGLWKSHLTMNDAHYQEQWHLDKISAEAAWDTTVGTQDVVVAVIDTGVDLQHEDLSNKLWQNSGEIPGNGLDDDQNGYPDDVDGWDFVSVDAEEAHSSEDVGPPDADVTDVAGHGTAMSGVVAAQSNNSIGIAGVAPGVTIMPVRAGFMIPDGRAAFQTTDIAKAIRYAADNGADVINMSFGGYQAYDVVAEAVAYAHQKGVVMVASAGNDSVGDFTFPAAYGHVLSVSALDSDDKWASFSNYGRWVDLSAPGVDVLTTLVGDEYGQVSGTSPAAAVVSGVAALTLASHPTWTSTQLSNQILATVDQVESLSSFNDVTRSPLLGAGRVNAEEATGPSPSESRAYRVLCNAQEGSGNGNQEIEEGESIVVTASWHVTAARAGLAARLVSDDPWVQVSSGLVPISVGDNEMAVVELAANVVQNVPHNHVASLGVELVDQWGVVNSGSLTVEIQPTWRALRHTPALFSPQFLPLGNGSEMLIASGSRYYPVTNVYATLRKANGAFGPLNMLSLEDAPGSQPSAVVEPNGDIHLCYSQKVSGSQGAPSYPSYVHYQAATDSWSETEWLSTEHVGPCDIALDASGSVHVAWGRDAIHTMQKLGDGSWSPRQDIETDDPASMEIDFLNLHGELQMIVRQDYWTEPDRVLLLEYDGQSWSTPQDLANATHLFQGRPFAWNDEAHLFYSADQGESINVSRLDRTTLQWSFLEQVVAPTGLTFGRSTASIPIGSAAFATLLAYPHDDPEARGVRLVHSIAGASYTELIPTDFDWDQRYPSVLEDSAGRFHAFVQQFQKPHDGWTYNWPRTSTYTTNAPLSGDAVPGAPVVVDDGTTTSDGGHLHASWSSAYSEDLNGYWVAWGTAPNTTDIVPWTWTTETELDIDLGPRTLVPDQIVYATVTADFGLDFESALGYSDGIRYLAPCDAALWDPNITYQDAGLRVTYQGAIYQSVFWSAGTLPTQPDGPWEVVSQCSGDPILPACSASDWEVTQTYQSGDQVSHGGAEWEARWTSTGLTPTGTADSPWKWLRGCTLAQ